MVTADAAAAGENHQISLHTYILDMNITLQTDNERNSRQRTLHRARLEPTNWLTEGLQGKALASCANVDLKALAIILMTIIICNSHFIMTVS